MPFRRAPPPPRIVRPGGAAANAASKFPRNVLRTTKYTPWTFLPKGLFEQFRRFANLYFLLIAAISLTPVSPLSPVTNITPLVAVVAASLVKEGVEDAKRTAKDRALNGRGVDVWVGGAGGGWRRAAWRDVAVGDVVRVVEGDPFPADMVILTSSNAEGIAYVETANLDGETNLKIKQCLEETARLASDDALAAALAAPAGAAVECEPPNSFIYRFAGVMMWGGKQLPLSPVQLLLRGCVLRNTAWVTGLVVYAGPDAKVAQNSTAAPSKRSRVERALDGGVVAIFLLLAALSAIDAVLGSAWVASRPWYLALGDAAEPAKSCALFDPARRAVVAAATFVTAVALYSTLIPISLYVSIEVVKLAQSAVFMARDDAMAAVEGGGDGVRGSPPRTVHAAPRTSNLNEELGQVSIVLSDKTGTLTANRMDFYAASIAGVRYGCGGEGGARGAVAAAERDGGATTAPPPGPRRSRLSVGGDLRTKFHDDRLSSGAWHASPAAPDVELFLRALALCHTVVTSGGGDGTTTNTADIRYQAASPDEVALVGGAADLGVALLHRGPSSVTIRQEVGVGGGGGGAAAAAAAASSSTVSPPFVDTTYDVLAVLEFTSARRRQSVVVRRAGGGDVELFCKGADSTLAPLLAADGATHWEATVAHLESFGAAGLRTLCVARRVIPPHVYADWAPRFAAARAAVVDRDAAVEAVGAELERELTLLGATAIEDRLQEGVGDTIHTLAQAGIRVWVLTGDRLETAVNVGYACRLLTDGAPRLEIAPRAPPPPPGTPLAAADAALHADVAAQLAAALADSGADKNSTTPWWRRRRRSAPPPSRRALVVDGAALGALLARPADADALLDLALRSPAVIFCRVSPLQKATIAKLLTAKRAGVTLAIGDGANDVGMIQAACVGVGIAGREGMQAAMASDVSVARFRFLVDLLLVHGRWSYRRIALVICYFFYKNAVYTLTQFWFNLFAAYSGQRFYDDWHQSLFNLVFTAVPVLAAGLLERDTSRARARASPALYRATAAGADLSAPALLAWATAAVWHSAVCFGVPVAALAVGAGGGADGAPLGLWPTGTLSFTCVVAVVNLKLVVASRSLTWLHAAVVGVSLALYFGYLAAYSAAPPSLLAPLAPAGAMAGVAGTLAVTPAAWIALAVAVVGALLPDVLLSARWGGGPGVVVVDDAASDVETAAAATSPPSRQPRLSVAKAASRRWSLHARAAGGGVAAAPRPPVADPAAPYTPPRPLVTALSHTGFAFAPPAEPSFHEAVETRDAVRRTAGSGSAPAGAVPPRPAARAAGSVRSAASATSAAVRPDFGASHPLASPRASTASPDGRKRE